MKIIVILFTVFLISSNLFAAIKTNTLLGMNSSIGASNLQIKVPKSVPPGPVEDECSIILDEDTGWAAPGSLRFNLGDMKEGATKNITCSITNGTPYDLYVRHYIGADWNDTIKVLNDNCPEDNVKFLSGFSSCSVTLQVKYKDIENLYMRSYLWFGLHGPKLDQPGWIWDFEGGIYFISINPTPVVVEPPAKNPVCDQGSIIRVDTQSFGESVSIVGTPYSLNYSSEFADGFKVNYPNEQPSYFKDDLWTVSHVHYFDIAHGRLFHGSGRSFLKTSKALSNGDLMVVDDGDVYIFNSSGKHLRTLSSLTGYTKFSFSYDVASGKLASIADAYGNLTTFNRDSYHSLVSITGPYGQTTLIGHEQYGNAINSITDPAGKVTTMTYYFGNGLLRRFTPPSGRYSEANYDGFGKLLSNTHLGGDGFVFDKNVVDDYNVTLKKTSASGLVWQYSSGRNSITNQFVRSEATPSAPVNTYYEMDGGTTTNNNGLVSNIKTFTQDERFGSLQNRISQNSTTILGVPLTENITQNISGLSNDPFVFSSITTNSVKNGKTYSKYFDKSNLRFTLTSPAGVVKKIEINSFEQPINEQLGNDLPVIKVYDGKGRIVSAGQGDNIRTFTYGPNGNISIVKNALDQQSKLFYDNAGRISNVTYPDNKVANFSYDDDGNLLSIETPKSILHLFTYNPQGLISSYISPILSQDTTSTKYSYDVDKRISKVLRPDGQKLSVNYDPVTGLMKQLSFGKVGSHFYEYKQDTKQLDYSVSYDGIKSTFGYYGPKLSYTSWNQVSTGNLYGAVSFTYDSEHRVKSRAVSGTAAAGSPSVINYLYNGDDNPVQIGDMTLVYEYPSGRIKTTAVGNISDNRTYDQKGLLKTYEVFFNSGGTPTSLYKLTLNRDLLDRVVEKNEVDSQGVTTYAYQYDNLGRLIAVQKNGSLYSHYNYDFNGNRIDGVTAGQSFVAVYDAQDRLMSYNGRQYYYNTNGDLTKVRYENSLEKTFRWDALSNLKEVRIPDGRVVSYKLDGANNRVAISLNGVTNNRYLYENKFRIAAHTTDAGIYGKRYTFGTSVNSPDYIKASGVNYFVVKDNLGSVRFVFNSSTGALVQKLEYSDLGKVLIDTNPGFQAYGFAGGLYDAFTGLVKFGAREYDGDTGRWLSKDPILFAGGDLNLYSYVQNDPINFKDPNGTNPALALIFTVGYDLSLFALTLDAVDQVQKIIDKVIKAGNEREILERNEKEAQRLVQEMLLKEAAECKTCPCE